MGENAVRESTGSRSKDRLNGKAGADTMIGGIDDGAVAGGEPVAAG
jgi:hypothetical protein